MPQPLASIRAVFFDLDGTLHQQDMLGCYLRYLAWHHWVNLPLALLCLPCVLLGLGISGRHARWPLSLLLWSLTFGRSHAAMQRCDQHFVAAFRRTLVKFPAVRACLLQHLMQENSVWLVTGSPEHLVQAVYHDDALILQPRLVGSVIVRGKGGCLLSRRCLSKEKVRQLTPYIEPFIYDNYWFLAGYSDSLNDLPVLRLCQETWRVDAKGHLLHWDVSKEVPRR